MEPTRGKAFTLNRGKGVVGDNPVGSFVPEIYQSDFTFLSKYAILHFLLVSPSVGADIR